MEVAVGFPGSMGCALRRRSPAPPKINGMLIAPQSSQAQIWQFYYYKEWFCLLETDSPLPPSSLAPGRSASHPTVTSAKPRVALWPSGGAQASWSLPAPCLLLSR